MAHFSYTFALVVLFSLFALALATPVPRKHTQAVKRSAGTATWFAPGLGACGGTNSGTDMIVALPSADFANGAHCNKVS